MPVHVERRGQGPTIVLVHGFTQTGRSWDVVADALAVDHEVVLLDAPGHGGSGAVDAGLLDGAALLVDAVGRERATWIGYSMGARWCLHVALQHPEQVTGLVLLGGTPGIEDDGERAERRARDLATAARVADLGVDAFLEGWMAQPLFAGLPAERAALEDRRRNTVAGLRSSLERAGTGVQAPVWDRLPELAMPVLAMAGALDERFAAIATRMAAAIGPNAEVALVPQAGHAAHLERPEPFIALVRAWLARQGPPNLSR
jgi:2-succinyl-6-hydroxy-2,4-cyclohexadiene-1-carboxylate synthase